MSHKAAGDQIGIWATIARLVRCWYKNGILRLRGRRFAVGALSGKAKAAVGFVDIAAALQAREQLGQCSAAPVAEVQCGSDFANALRAADAGEICKQAGFVDFVRTGREAILIRVTVFFLHEGAWASTPHFIVWRGSAISRNFFRCTGFHFTLNPLPAFRRERDSHPRDMGAVRKDRLLLLFEIQSVGVELAQVSAVSVNDRQNRRCEKDSPETEEHTENDWRNQ